MAKVSGKALAKLRQRFGARLRDVREKRELTQPDVSKQSGIDQASISLYEAGEKEPRLSRVFRLAAALSVDAGALFEEPGTSINGR